MGIDYRCVRFVLDNLSVLQTVTKVEKVPEGDKMAVKIYGQGKFVQDPLVIPTNERTADIIESLALPDVDVVKIWQEQPDGRWQSVLATMAGAALPSQTVKQTLAALAGQGGSRYAYGVTWATATKVGRDGEET